LPGSGSANPREPDPIPGPDPKHRLKEAAAASYQVLVHAGNVVGGVYGAGRGSNGGGQDQVLRGKGGMQVLKYQIFKYDKISEQKIILSSIQLQQPDSHTKYLWVFSEGIRNNFRYLYSH
jgi:hypothetical protein